MVRIADLRALCACAALCVVTAAVAQDAQPTSPAADSPPTVSTTASTASTTSVATPAPTGTANPIVRAPGEARPSAPQVPTPTPWHGRMVSSDVAAQLAAAAPKYSPPAPKPPPRQDEEPAETDQPKNHIIHLPRYVVHAPPPPILNERTVNTEKGLEDIAMRRYLTDMDRALNRFTLPLFGTSAGQRALEMYREDERLKNMADLKDDAAMVSTTDKAAGLYVKKQVDQTFIRPGDFDWKPIGR